ncbi:MAG TPA: alpha/beta hydrolase-fold protein [Planctomycetota bacterium]|nr:alpha/beta hydrolase-fold protein [Planctomycetota bacterium]
MKAPLHQPSAFAGRVETPGLASELLRGNRAGDPHDREVAVYLPPDAGRGGERLPQVWLLAAFTATARGFLETHPWRRGVVARYDAEVAAGRAPRAILVLPDCFTRFGGSQYVDSSFLGPYESHLVQEVVPFVDEHYPVRAGPRAVVGKSSGGFGALRLGMRHPELFGAVGSISGDVAFEDSLGMELLGMLRGLVPYDGDPAKFLLQFMAEPDLSGDGHAVINALAMAACYSPNPASALGFDLPVDLRTGERIESVWQRWLAFDPLNAVVEHADSLKRLRSLHLECGLRDEFHLQWGTRRLSARLRELGVPHHHEEHAGGHRGLDHRLLALLPKLVAALDGA